MKKKAAPDEGKAMYLLNLKVMDVLHYTSKTQKPATATVVEVSVKDFVVLVAQDEEKNYRGQYSGNPAVLKALFPTLPELPPGGPLQMEVRTKIENPHTFFAPAMLESETVRKRFVKEMFNVDTALSILTMLPQGKKIFTSDDVTKAKQLGNVNVLAAFIRLPYLHAKMKEELFRKEVLVMMKARQAYGEKEDGTVYKEHLDKSIHELERFYKEERKPMVNVKGEGKKVQIVEEEEVPSSEDEEEDEEDEPLITQGEPSLITQPEEEDDEGSATDVSLETALRNHGLKGSDEESGEEEEEEEAFVPPPDDEEEEEESRASSWGDASSTSSPFVDEPVIQPVHFTMDQFEEWLELPVWEINEKKEGGLEKIEKSKEVREGNKRMTKSEGVVLTNERAEYGRLNPEFVEQIIKEAKIGDVITDKFLDVGSGIGTVVLQVAATTGLRSRGVELMIGRHEIAEKFLAQYNAYKEDLKHTNAERKGTEAEVYLGHVDFVHANFATKEIFDSAVKDYAIVFANNAEGVFGDRSETPEKYHTLDWYLALMMCKKAVGHKLIVLGRLDDLEYQAILEDCFLRQDFESEPGATSWSSAKTTTPFSIYTKIADEWTCPNCKTKNPLWRKTSGKAAGKPEDIVTGMEMVKKCSRGDFTARPLPRPKV